MKGEGVGGVTPSRSSGLGAPLAVELSWSLSARIAPLGGLCTDRSVFLVCAQQSGGLVMELGVYIGCKGEGAHRKGWWDLADLWAE